MESIFVTVLNMSITGGLIVAVLALLRLMFKACPEGIPICSGRYLRFGSSALSRFRRS